MHTTFIKRSWHQSTTYISSKFNGNGWPYIPGDTASVEATSWCAIALAHLSSAAKAAASFLIDKQNADGGWANAPAPDLSDWSTGPALLALRLIENNLPGALQTRAKRAFEDGTAFLLGSRTDFYVTFPAKVMVWLLTGGTGLDYARGWPWTPGCYHWVEPTGYTLMALKPSAQAQREDVRHALVKAEEFLFEHACAGGGWNYGENVSFSVKMPPKPVTTAVALAALQDRVDHQELTQQSLAYLESAAAKTDAVMTLSWCILALDVAGRQTEKICKNLVQRQQPDGGFGNNLLLTALASCALSAALGKNPLKFA